MTEKWLNNFIDVSRVSDRMVFMKVLFQEITNSVISVYVPQCGLDNSNRDNFYDTLISFIRK